MSCVVARSASCAHNGIGHAAAPACTHLVVRVPPIVPASPSSKAMTNCLSWGDTREHLLLRCALPLSRLARPLRLSTRSAVNVCDHWLVDSDRVGRCGSLRGGRRLLAVRLAVPQGTSRSVSSLDPDFAGSHVLRLDCGSRTSRQRKLHACKLAAPLHIVR